MNVGGEEGPDAEDDDEELYRDVNINLEGRDVQMTDFVTSMLNPNSDTCIDSLFESTHKVDAPVSIAAVPLLVTAPTLPPPSIPIMSQVQQAPTPTQTTAPSSCLKDLPNFGSLFGFDHRLKTLEANFSEFIQTNQFARAVSSIPAQAENEDFINKLDENIQKIIKEQVYEQVKVQVSKILPKIEKTVNEQLEAKVLTRSSNLSKTSYVVAVDLSEPELKKILIEKMESNKSIHRSDEQKNLYKALVDTYECDKIILDTYGDTASKTTGKSTEGSKSHQKTVSESAPAEEPMQTTQDLEEPSHQEFETGVADDQPITEASQHPEWFQKQTKPQTPDCAWNKTLPATYESIQPWISDLAKQADSCASFNELMDTPVDFLAFLMNRLNVDTLTPELLVGPTYDLMKGSCKSLVELEFFLKEVIALYLLITSSTTTSSIYVVVPQVESIQLLLRRQRQQIMSTSSGLKTWYLAQCGVKHWESARDVYSKRRIIAVTELQIFEWHDYKHMDWIIVRRDDNKLYKFKEGYFKRIRIQDIEDIIVIQRRMKDLQLGVKSYQKRLNLTKPDTYKTDLKRKEAYTAYSNPRGFIYQNKDKH
nr:hypothetical protein [Tanacetum cinerariifolium]